MTFVTEYGDVSVTLLLVIGTSQIRISLESSAVLSVVVVSASFSRKIPSLPDSSHVIISTSHPTTRSCTVRITDSIKKQNKNHDTGVFLSGRRPSFLCRSAQKPDSSLSYKDCKPCNWCSLAAPGFYNACLC